MSPLNVCRSGFKFIPETGGCYMMVNNPMTRENAMANCMQNEAYLLGIKDQKEEKSILSECFMQVKQL